MSGQSKTRGIEAKVIVRELVAALEADEHLTFGVIAFYSGQVRAVWEELERIGYAVREGDLFTLAPSVKALWTVDGLERVRVGTVDAFQGREFDVVYLSTTRSQPLDARHAPRFGFLALPNRLCVAMSLQRRLLVVVGDSAMFTHNDAKAQVPALAAFHELTGVSMAIVDQRELPVHLAADLDRRSELVVLAPAQRWRTLIDGVSHHQGDVLLATVARLTAAGAGPLQISEALQLPHDLIAHLVARVRQERIKVAENGRTLVSESATLGWTYRDLISTIQPRDRPGRPPVEVRWQQDQATFSAGTTGNPRRIRAAALFASRADPARPSPHELVRLASGRPDGESRLTLVGVSEPCLLVHPVQVVDGEVVVADVAARPQLHLTRALHETARVKPALRALAG